MSNASDAAKARRHYLKEHDPEKYQEYLRRQRERRKAVYAKKTTDEKRAERQKHSHSQAGHYRKYERKAWRGIINGMKKRAAKKGIPFDDTIDIDFMISITPTHCPILGIKLERMSRSESNRQASPSVDRLDPRAGYTRDNIIVVSYLANTIRTCATSDQIIRVGEFYKQLLEGLGIKE